MAKIRLKVEIPSQRDTSDSQLVRYVVPIPSDASVADLISEISRRQAFSDDVVKRIRLTLSDASVLFKDDVVGDVLESGEVVQLHFEPKSSPVHAENPEKLASSHIAPHTRSASRGSFDANTPAFQDGNIPEDDITKQGKRVRIALVTPELARNGESQASSKIMAFGGSTVSTSMSMDVVRRETARSLGWLDDEDAFGINTHDESAPHIPTGTCSCTTANQMFVAGRLGQLHCPRQIDGSHCGRGDCPYSHSRIASGVLGTSPTELDCKICTEPFGFPCEKCLKALDDGHPTAESECPLVQNAGCNHIFHAHCYFAHATDSTRCPAGCSASMITREAIPFDTREPHLLIVHSGFTIDNVPIPRTSRTSDSSVILTDKSVMAILSERYAGQGPALTVRMFGRTNQGLVTFRHSSIVSICCATRHATPDGIVRFPLNEASHRLSQVRRYNIDLHTFRSPIFNESPDLTISGLGLDDEVENNAEITLYVVKRKDNGNVKQQNGTARTPVVGKSAVYTESDSWQPMVEQSARGVATFLSSLFVFVNYLSLYNKEDTGTKNMHTRAMHHLLALTRFPPAVRALHILTANETPTPEEMKALSETLYHLVLGISHPSITKGDKSRVFEGARVFFGNLIERTKGPFVLLDEDTTVSTVELVEKVSLTCDLSGEPLRDPVRCNNMIVERAAVMLRQRGGPLFDPVSTPLIIESPPDDLSSTILRSTTHKMTLRHIMVAKAIVIPHLLSQKVAPTSLSRAIDVANLHLQIYAPLSLKDQAVTPAMTLDEAGFNAVYISRGGPCAEPGEDVILLRPCHGGETGIDVNAVAVRLQPIIEHKKALGEWEVDAFGTSRSDRMDSREIEEAVVIALDLSRSMGEEFDSASGREHTQEDQIDTDERAQDEIKRCFSERARQDGDVHSVLGQVETFIKDLQDLPSIARYTFRSLADVTTLARAGWRVRAFEANRTNSVSNTLDELILLFSRMHWRASQLSSNQHSIGTPSLLQIENFVVASLDPRTRHSVVRYLEDALTQVQENHSWGGIKTRFLDPFTGRVFVDPVRAGDGHVYERLSIAAWLQEYPTSPFNPDEPLTQVYLTPDRLTSQAVTNLLNGRPRDALFAPTAGRPQLIAFTTRDSDAHSIYLPLIGSRTAMSILFDYAYFKRSKPSKHHLWSGLEDVGDGVSVGQVLDTVQPLINLVLDCPSPSPNRNFLAASQIAVRPWRHIAVGAERHRNDSRSLSRLDIVKQAFEAFVNKSEAFDHPIAIGLVTFGKQVKEVQSLTLLKESFRTAVQNVEASGDTPLYDSLSTSLTMLSSFKRDHPSARLRIICLTDGEDIGSRMSPSVIARKLQQSSIVVDSIVVQLGSTSKLHAIAKATSGYSFVVETLENALSIMELETVLQSADRVEKPPQSLVQNEWELLKYNNLRQHPVDVVTSESCPQRRPHERIDHPVLSAKLVAGNSVLALSSTRGKRLMQEIRDVVNQPHPSIDVYTGNDMAFWKIVISAPEGSPYAGGTFLAYVAFGDDYPQTAPEVRFITPILHPNINRHGKVCHAVFDRGWMVDMSMSVIFQILYGLLLTPDVDNPLDLHATMEYNDDTGQHALKVHDMVEKFASKGRDEWQRELEGVS